MTRTQAFVGVPLVAISIIGLIIGAKEGVTVGLKLWKGHLAATVRIPAAILFDASSGGRCVVAVPPEYLTEDGEVWLHTHSDANPPQAPDSVSWFYDPAGRPYYIKFLTQPFTGDPPPADPLLSQPLNPAVSAKCSNFFSSCYYSYNIYLDSAMAGPPCNKDVTGKVAPYGIHITK